MRPSVCWQPALLPVPVPTHGALLRVRALELPGEGHAIASVEGNAHAVQSAVAWLVEKLTARVGE